MELILVKDLAHLEVVDVRARLRLHIQLLVRLEALRLLWINMLVLRCSHTDGEVATVPGMNLHRVLHLGRSNPVDLVDQPTRLVHWPDVFVEILESQNISNSH